MLNTNYRRWNFSYLNGILTIIFGLVALLFPTITIKGLAIYFAITILLGGIILIISSFRIRFGNTNWPMILLEGLAGTLIGIFILARPESAAAILVALIGIWSLFIGLVFIWVYSRKSLPEIANTFHLTAGILAIIVGLLILVNPFGSTRFIVVLIGIYAIIYGVFSIVSTSKNQ